MDVDARTADAIAIAFLGGWLGALLTQMPSIRDGTGDLGAFAIGIIVSLLLVWLALRRAPDAPVETDSDADVPT